MGQLATMAQRSALAPAQSRAITFTDDSGMPIRITSEDVRRNICESATDKEIVYFLELCRAKRLNPFTQEAYLVKYGTKPAQMITAHKVFVQRAAANPDYLGMKHGVVVLRDGKICKEERTAYYEEAGEKLIGGWCDVYVKGRETVHAEVSLKEMSKGQSTWQTMPSIMIDKCAQSKALREAFPHDFNNLYLSEEGGAQVSQITETVTAAEEDTLPDAYEALKGVAARIAELKGKDEGEVMEAILKCRILNEMGYEFGNQLTDEQLGAALGFANHWLAKAEQEGAEPVEVIEPTVEIEPEDIDF